MKKFTSTILLSVLGAELFAAGFETDVSVFSELSSAYNSGFYPGTVQYADRLVSEFPESAYTGSALVMKGESLVRLGQFDEALEALLSAEKLDKDSSLKNSGTYWLGRVYDAKKDYDSAIRCYHDYCSSAGEKAVLYPAAILNAGGVYYKNGEFKKAVPNFEYAVMNGNRYSSSDYYSALLKLADSYNNSGAARSTVELYGKFKQESLPSTVYFAFTEYTGDAYKELKEYRKSYEYYCTVLASGERSLAANALKKAYKVSAEHRKEVGAEPGVVLQDAQKTLSDSPELLAEFWTRLGTDAFVSGDYAKATEYFKEAEKHATPELFEFISMYRAEITAGKNITVASAKAAEKELLAAQKIQQEMKNPSYVDDYNGLLAKYAAYQNRWDEVKKYAEAGKNPNERTNFYLALANYKTGDYSQSSKLLEKTDLELYALSLARQQKLKESASVYNMSDKGGKMTAEERLNYSKVLILSGRFKESQIQAAKSGLNEGKYILGLAQFNTRSWPYAEESFASFIKNADKKDAGQLQEVSYAMFYQGYSQYRQNKCKEAYLILSSFLEQYPSHELVRNAQMTAANCSVQLGKYGDAAKMAEKAVQSSNNMEEKEDSVLLLAEIYSDAGEYQKALDVLTPYSRQKNDFGMNSLYQMAHVYEKMKDYKTADSKYKEVADKFSSQKMGEEALYRRGELCYGLDDFSTALQRFNEYKNKYQNGTFVDASWYYAADCMAKTGNVSSAILQNQALIKKFPESTYVYSSTKNLIELYRSEGKYNEALENARFLLKKYGDQARNDGIGESASQLEKLAGGKSEEIVAKETEYRKAGAMNTPEGRKAGTELAAILARSADTSREAVSLAEQILPLQEKYNKNDAETMYAAQNADILGQAYRSQEKNKLSAEMFLKAARYYRISGKSDEAAAVMYGAYDAFLSAGMKADANATATQLKELYPTSKQARSVKTDN